MIKKINKYKMASNKFKTQQRIQNWLNSRVVHLKEKLARDFDDAVLKKADELFMAKYNCNIRIKNINFDRGSPQMLHFQHARWENGKLIHEIDSVELELLRGMAVDIGNLTPEQAMYVNIGVLQSWALFTEYENRLKGVIPASFHKKIDYTCGSTIRTR